MTNIYELFKEESWKPEDYTNCFWCETSWGIRWSDESNNPDEWEESYSSDRVREATVKDGYKIATLDDDCGGRYQAIFDLSKKIEV